LLHPAFTLFVAHRPHRLTNHRPPTGYGARPAPPSYGAAPSGYGAPTGARPAHPDATGLVSSSQFQNQGPSGQAPYCLQAAQPPPQSYHLPGVGDGGMYYQQAYQQQPQQHTEAPQNFSHAPLLAHPSYSPQQFIPPASSQQLQQLRRVMTPYTTSRVMTPHGSSQPAPSYGNSSHANGSGRKRPVNEMAHGNETAPPYTAPPISKKQQKKNL
jgi:hypothetical protein